MSRHASAAGPVVLAVQPCLSTIAHAARLLAGAACASVLLAPVAARADDDMPMQQVTITGTAESGYGASHSTTATKTDTALRDTPQAITVVTKELIRDQAMQSMADVIRYVPGVVTAQGEGNRDTAVFRGNSSTGDFFIDGMRDDVQYYRDFYNIDSVEALKGANAMIFGRGGSGGVINRVSKQPEWNYLREASLTLGSWANRRLTADVGQVVNDSVAVRVNGLYEKSGSFRDGVSVERSGINPTVGIRAGANTSVVLGYEHFDDDRTADRGIPSYQGKPFDTDPSTFFGNAKLSRAKASVDAFTAVIEHDLGHGATLRNRTRYADYDKFYQNVFPGAVNAAGTSVDIKGYNNATARRNLFNQTDLTFDVRTGALLHKLATGVELGRQVTDNYRNTAYFPTVGANATSITVPTSDPVMTAPVTFRQAASDADNHGTSTVVSVYVQDQLQLSPQWQAIAGLRYDRFKVDFLNHRNNTTISVTDTPVSPRAGLVYKPVEAVSIYGSYSLAYLPRAGDQLASLTPTNAAFDPEQFKNLELGVKWDVLPKLAATLAIYRLDRKNVVVADPSDPTKSVLADGQRSKGVELGLSGNVGKNWSVMGGYAYQDAKLTADVAATGPYAGAVLAQVPKHSASLWNRYDVSDALGAALGIIYRSSIYPSTANNVVLPGFTRFDGALYYTVNRKLQVQLNVENLFDKKYYAAANSNDNISPGSPRAIKLGLNAKF
ncbi:TonB-dependent receptor [Rugamonas brunnea]|nr:TonB-dependent siderophore receptor [Rugamonas brunnea]